MPPTHQILVGDCLDLLRQIPDNSVDSVVTDQPYGLSFMGKKWDYDVPATEVWVECLRVLKPGGHLLAFAGTRTQHRMAVRIEDAGFEIRDMIAWVYGSGFPKSRNIAEQDMTGADYAQWEGWGTALKPSLEPITMARKPMDKGLTVAANVIKWGAGAICVDGCRVASDDPNPSISRRQGSTSHLSTRSAAKSVAAGKLESRQSPEAYRTERAGEALGRWPANLIHDGSDDVVALFPVTTSGGGPKPGTPRTKANTYGDPTISESHAYGSTTGNAARFFYCAKTSKKDRNDGLDAFPETTTKTFEGGKIASGKTPDSMGGERTSRNSHPTVKPTDLMAYLCRLVTPAGGIVLDPFMGSGSTGKAAMREGFEFIGCEIDEQYAAIARARIEFEVLRKQEQKVESDQLDLFATA